MLNKLVRRRGGGAAGTAGPPVIFLGAFGKHPAWHDHIHPAIGLEGRLTGVMETLYLGGIQKSIAAWREAAASDLVPFAHLFVWRTPADLVIGRMWHSRDAANPPRTDYPMVVCAQCTNVPLDWALAHVPAALDRLEAACKAATKRDAVEEAVTAARDELRREASSAAAANGDGSFDHDPDAPARAVVALADDPRVGAEGLQRVTYVLHEASPSSPRQARAPRAADSEAEALRRWGQFMEARFGNGGGPARDLTRVLVAPAGGDWVDLILGEPDASHFRTLRYSTNLVAPDTQTAYSLDDSFVRESDDFVARCRRNAAASTTTTTNGGAAGQVGLGMTEVSSDAASGPAGRMPALAPLPAPVGAVDSLPLPTRAASRRWKHLTLWILLGILLALAISVLVVVGQMDPNGAGPPR
jgi:hypothetical protein